MIGSVPAVCGCIPESWLPWPPKNAVRVSPSVLSIASRADETAFISKRAQPVRRVKAQREKGQCKADIRELVRLTTYGLPIRGIEVHKVLGAGLGATMPRLIDSRGAQPDQLGTLDKIVIRAQDGQTGIYLCYHSS